MYSYLYKFRHFYGYSIAELQTLGQRFIFYTKVCKEFRYKQRCDKKFEQNVSLSFLLAIHLNEFILRFKTHIGKSAI
jgi:hypothetical protein